MDNQTSETVTVQDFLELLDSTAKGYKVSAKTFVYNFSDFLRNDILTKQMMANITHSFMDKIMDEPDNLDWSPARLLKDIYECHICVVNISQCYVKGIIPLQSENVFGYKEKVKPEMAKEVVKRIFDKSSRLEVKSVAVPEIKKIALVDITKLENPRLIDVRTMPEDLLSDKVDFIVENIPLRNIIQNPYCIGSDYSQNIVLYCAKGYQSTLAADVLKKAGYINIYTVQVNSGNI